MHTNSYRRLVAAWFTAMTAIGALLVGLAPPTSAEQTPRRGAYEGTIYEDGAPSPKEWLTFRVTTDRTRVKAYTSRIWVHCYEYPNTYTTLPVRFTAPTATIRSGVVDRSWQQAYTVDGEVYTLHGRLQLHFWARGKVTGRVSIDFANCASRLGDAPYWIPLRAKRS